MHPPSHPSPDGVVFYPFFHNTKETERARERDETDWGMGMGKNEGRKIGRWRHFDQKVNKDTSTTLLYSVHLHYKKIMLFGISNSNTSEYTYMYYVIIKGIYDPFLVHESNPLAPLLYFCG